MDRYLRQTGLLDALAHAPTRIAARMRPAMGPADIAGVIWLIFAATVTLSILPQYFGEPAGFLTYVLAVGSSAACGWAWLLSRALFRAEQPIARWNLIAVAVIIVIEAGWHLTSPSAGHAPGADAEIGRIATNAASLVCIGALMMVFVEVLSGYSIQLSRAERRFRQIFCLVFSGMIVLTLVWAAGAGGQSDTPGWADAVIIAGAVACVGGARLAIAFRRRHPLPMRKVSKAVSAAATDQALAARILRSLNHNQLFATPDLKVADLARVLDEQEYKVTSCITGHLGFRNFNQLVNAHRIDHAGQMLADPQHRDSPILTIALDCGFNSVGPFNRAFKQRIGMTPSAYRASARARKS